MIIIKLVRFFGGMIDLGLRQKMYELNVEYFVYLKEGCLLKVIENKLERLKNQFKEVFVS